MLLFGIFTNTNINIFLHFMVFSDMKVDISLNCRYDSSTGTFTVPPGGDGFYYFSTYLLGDDLEMGRFDIQINGDILCTVRVEQEIDASEYPQSTCSAAIFTAEGILGSPL